MNERRFFSGRERVALYLAADGRCSECGAELEPGWHGDHVNPWSKGGRTDVINGQALCPRCNEKKGARPVVELREWQAEALERFLRRPNDFLCVATPGAGKTRFALAGAERLMQAGTVRQIIVVSPTSHLRKQWADAAHRDFGIQLDRRFTNPAGAVAKDFDGVVVTYQSVASEPLLWRRLSTHIPTLVILDEIHHGGDVLSWGKALAQAFDAAAVRLLLSGTPDRTDGNAVPFVQYDEGGKFAAGYSYDYGEALADRQGVVRQVAFPTFDGDTRWLEAGVIESRMRLSDADEQTRAKALNSALLPDGPWIASVLREANKELSRQRELVSDAGGLVVASGQAQAMRYARTLEQITGEPATVAVSDMPDASDRITEFAIGTSRWIIAVAMVSEGVDIPRLVVGVYATNISTDLFFRQVSGRLVRTRGPEDESCATLFIPSVQPLVSYAAAIERTIPQALREAEERAQREEKQGPTQLELEIVQRTVPLAASDAVHTATILGGDSFSEAELERAQVAGQLAGLPASLTAVQIARLARVLGGGATVGKAVVEIPKRSLGDEKAIVRKELQRRVGYLARLTDRPHSHIGNDLMRATGGGPAKTAELATLRKRQEIVERWIADVQDGFGSYDG